MDSLPADWRWALAQGEAARRLPPYAIHQKTFPRDHADRPVKSAAIIRSRPFTVDFERYVDGEDEHAPILTALADIHSDPSLRLEFEAIWAIVVGGHDDMDVLDAVLGRPNGFEDAAVRGLRLLRERTIQIVQKKVAETDQRRETAGQSALARAEDSHGVKSKFRRLPKPAI